MSLISKARVLSKTCNFVVKTSNFNNIVPKCIADHVTIKALSPASQCRLYSDKPDESHIQTIHSGRLSRNIKYIKLFSLSTSAGSLALQPYLIPKVLATGSTTGLLGVIFTSGFFAFVTPILLHFITGKYITRIKYDEKRDVYIATAYTLFVKEHKIEFTPDDVTKPGLSEMMTTCYINDTPYFFDVSDFTEIDHYSKILGYDKPMDFQLETQENSQFEDPEKPKKS